MTFEWDAAKAESNKLKHGISFEDARGVFYDEAARLIHDIDNSIEEDRFILLGLSFKLRLLTVVHAYKKENEVIRIISARKATSKEQSLYRRYK